MTYPKSPFAIHRRSVFPYADFGTRFKPNRSFYDTEKRQNKRKKLSLWLKQRGEGNKKETYQTLRQLLSEF